MSKKPSNNRKNVLDIPPVPAATRFINQNPEGKSSHLSAWVGDLLGIEFEEIALNNGNPAQAQLFVERKNKLAVHLIDGLFVPESKRLSHTSLSVIEHEAFLTIHLAIASPEKIRSTLTILQENPPQNESELQAANILHYFTQLQTPAAIFEAFHYENFIAKEIFASSPWGATLFAKLAEEQPIPDGILDQKQEALIALGSNTGASKQASQFFISLFASQELKSSFPQLSQYSAAIIPAGLNIPIDRRHPWAQAVIQEWSELWEREMRLPGLTEVDDRDSAAQWLGETIDSFAG